MKHHFPPTRTQNSNSKLALSLALLALASSLLSLPAAVPLRWTVETSKATPAAFEAYQGETLDLEAALTSHGKPLQAPLNYALYWQTNGMGAVYWSTNCATAAGATNVMRATWRPEFDAGAKAYNCFIGAPGDIYHAAFQLRLRPSPGASPGELPLPTPTLDFARVTVLNPPWPATVSNIVTRQYVENLGIRSADGAARPLPPYLHALDFDDSYPDDAAWYYAQPQDFGGCSARRTGNLLERNYDWKFDDAAEFVVRMSAGVQSDGAPRFASVGVANVGTNLTEAAVTSGKWSRYYKALPGHTVDGINENGVVAEVNVTAGTWPRTEGDIHALGAVRWVLDNATSAGMAASNLAARVYVPQGFGQNFHWMIADSDATWIVENGAAHLVTNAPAVMTNFALYPTRGAGEGQERYDLLLSCACCITQTWWTLTYTPQGYRASDLPNLDTNLLFRAWAAKSKAAHRGETFGGETWWQTVHTSVYDITNRVLRVAVQERPDWYTFAVPSAGGGVATETDPVATPRVTALEAEVAAIPRITESENNDGWAANADNANEAITALYAQQSAVATDAENAAKIIGSRREFDAYAIAAIEQAATNAESSVATNAAAIASHSSQLSQLSQAVDGKRDTEDYFFPERIYLGSGLNTDYDVEFSELYGHFTVKDTSAGESWHIDLPTNSGVVALLSDIPPPPGDYAAVSNAAMTAIHWDVDLDGQQTALTVGDRSIDYAREWTDEYDPRATYSRGVYTLHDGEVYVCIADEGEEVTGPWDPSLWSSHPVGPRSVAVGTCNVAMGSNCVVIGEGHLVLSDYAFAQGYYTWVGGFAAHAEGYSSYAVGNYSHAEGNSSSADGECSHAEGESTCAGGHGSHAEGFGSGALAVYSHVGGIYCRAGDDENWGEGFACEASGVSAVAASSMSWCWQGHGPDIDPFDAPYYRDHGPGTFNLNPYGGLSGFWVGETNMADHVSNAATTAYRDATNYTDSVVGNISAVLDAILGGH